MKKTILVLLLLLIIPTVFAAFEIPRINQDIYTDQKPVILKSGDAIPVAVQRPVITNVPKISTEVRICDQGKTRCYTNSFQVCEKNSWIIKQNVLLDTTEINEDLVATVWNSPKEMRYTDGEEPFIFHEGAVLKNAGVIEVMYPSELNFGYTAQQKPTPFNDYRPLPETFLEKYGLLLFWFLILLIHLYIGATLFFLARKLSIHHRWRAWLPVFNLSLLVALAGKKWWWFAGICLLPILIAFLIALNSSSWWYYTPGLIDNYPFDWFFDSIQFIFGWIAVMFFFIEYGLLDRIFTSLVARGGRPTWWGPLMILVPPVGLVFLGILAWSKHTPNILNEKIQ